MHITLCGLLHVVCTHNLLYKACDAMNNKESRPYHDEEEN